MARHFEKSGELLICYSSPDSPATEEPEAHKRHGFGVWLALLVVVMGMLLFTPYALG